MKKLNSNHLKLIAIIAMTIDNLGDLLYPDMPNVLGSNIMHIIGKVKWMKWFFYIYYPLHLVIIGILRLYMYGNITILFN